MVSDRRGPLALLGLGLLGVLAGGAMVAGRYHHTIGLGVLGIGVLLAIGGLVFYVRTRINSGPKTGIAGTASNVATKRTLKSALTIVFVVVVAVASFGYASYVSSQIGAGSKQSLDLSVNASTEVAYPNGTVAVRLSLGATGGSQPYSFSAHWGDGLVQTSPVGNFTRSFRPGQSIVTALTVTATSAARATGSLFLTLPSQAISAAPGGASTQALSGSVSSSSATSPGSSGSGVTTTLTTTTSLEGTLTTITSTITLQTNVSTISVESSSGDVATFSSSSITR